MRVWDLLATSRSQPLPSFGGQPLLPTQTWRDAGQETLPTDFSDYATSGMKDNSVVWAAIQARAALFSEAEFRFQNITNRKLYGSSALKPLEAPWPGGSTATMLTRMLVDGDLSGNAYLRIVGDGYERLRPDSVDIVSDVQESGRRETVGYIWWIDGRTSPRHRLLDVSEVMHWVPMPDPLASFRGMSWLTPVAREIVGDSAMSRHKNKFFELAATPNLLIKYSHSLTQQQRDQIRSSIDSKYASIDNAYRTLVLDAGAETQVIGNSFEQMSFATTQAAGENRIAVAAGVPATVLGIKEGLQGSSLNAGNYVQSMRRFADLTIRPLWRSACHALSSTIDVPADSRLWYEDRFIAALQQDAADEADIRGRDAATIRTLIEAGFTADAAIGAVKTGDLTELAGAHSGLVSVQLQKPGADGKKEKARNIERDETGRIVRIVEAS